MKTFGVQQLELTVMVHNDAAQALYTKMGFVIEGRRQRSLVVDGAFVDEYSMVELIPMDRDRLMCAVPHPCQTIAARDGD